MKRGRKATIGIAGLTPLLDTLFILLFALLALSDVRTSNRTEEVRIRLPAVEPGAGPAEGSGQKIAVEIGPDSSIVLKDSGESVATREELDRALALALGQRLPEEVVVEIHADREAKHGIAVELLQHLRLRGFIDVQLLAIGYEDLEGPFGGSGR